MVKARKYVVKKHFQGMPKRDDYEIVEEQLPAIKNGEILVKAEYISVDPYLRSYNHKITLPYDQFSLQVGVVLESKNPKFPVGSRVVSRRGWRDYYIADPAEPVEDPAETMYKLPDFKGLPVSLGVGAIGMPGVSAYYGFLDICEPKAGETVVVTGAAGAVGSLVGQIAKIKGCRVIGFAGADDKVQWLEKELGFDKAINYKTADVAAALKEAAPEGVDCYFDNVGGELSSVIIHQMNRKGRVSVCGSISSYNEAWTKLPKATIIQPIVVFNQLKIQGFICWDWLAEGDKWYVGLKALVDLVKSGQLKAPEHVTVGFDKLYDAFVGMLAGQNSGKAVVKV